MRRLLAAALAFAAVATAQTFEATPANPRQGDTIRLKAPKDAAQARLNGRTVRLYDGEGLMPVPALEKPGTYSLEYLNAAGAAVETRPIVVRDARFLKQNVVIGKSVMELTPAPGEMETMAKFRATVTDVRHWAEPFALPVPGCRSSPYGSQRLYNGKASGSFHSGFDQVGKAGDPIRAIAAGTVQVVRMWNVHGGTVAVDHGQGVGSIYLHMSRMAVAEGQFVKQGEVVGYIGSTGRSNAPHLHWGLYVNKVAVNPGQWVKVSPCTAPRAPVKKSKKG